MKSQQQPRRPRLLLGMALIFLAGTLPGEVEAKIEGISGIESADVEIVWDPVWNPGMMSEAEKLELGMMDY